MDGIFNWFRGHIHGESATVTHAPILFFMAVLIVSAGLYLLIRAHFAERIEALKATLGHKDSLLSEYKDRLKGATPMEVATEIAHLKDQVLQLTSKVNRPQRKLSEAQINRLKSLCTKDAVTQNYPIFISSSPDTESSRFATAMAKTFNEAGLHAVMNSLGKHDEGEYGVIFYSPEEHPDEQLMKIAAAFDELGIEYSRGVDPDNPGHSYIFICPNDT